MFVHEAGPQALVQYSRLFNYTEAKSDLENTAFLFNSRRYSFEVQFSKLSELVINKVSNYSRDFELHPMKVDPVQISEKIPSSSDPLSISAGRDSRLLGPPLRTEPMTRMLSVPFPPRFASTYPVVPGWPSNQPASHDSFAPMGVFSNGAMDPNASSLSPTANSFAQRTSCRPEPRPVQYSSRSQDRLYLHSSHSPHPSQNFESLPPSQNFESLPPSQRVESLPPSQRGEPLSSSLNFEPLPTSQNFESLSSSHNFDPLPPSQSLASLSISHSPHLSQPFEPLSSSLHLPSAAPSPHDPSSTRFHSDTFREEYPLPLYPTLSFPAETPPTPSSSDVPPFELARCRLLGAREPRGCAPSGLRPLGDAWREPCEVPWRGWSISRQYRRVRSWVLDGFVQEMPLSELVNFLYGIYILYADFVRERSGYSAMVFGFSEWSDAEIAEYLSQNPVNGRLVRLRGASQLVNM